MSMATAVLPVTMTLEIPYCFSQEGARPLISLTRSAVALLVWPPVGTT